MFTEGWEHHISISQLLDYMIVGLNALVGGNKIWLRMWFHKAIGNYRFNALHIGRGPWVHYQVASHVSTTSFPTYQRKVSFNKGNW